jgi:drug/metabolite transporter (DMT)-like permease
MVILLGLAAAVLYGSGDFLGGMATRRAHVLAVLMVANTAAVIVALAAAAMSPGHASLADLTWGIGAGLTGGLGLIIFYIGLATGPMSVVAPVSGLLSTILPVAVALTEGERPGPGVYAGALLCLVAVVLASSAGHTSAVPGHGRPGPGRAIAYGIASGALFGLFFLLIRNAAEEVAAAVEHGRGESEQDHHDAHLRSVRPPASQRHATSLVTSKTILEVSTRPVKSLIRSRVVEYEP